jgi:leader peptidase (prepilin peptidase) / N-methyltransferase
VSLVLPAGAAVFAACCGWPASRIVRGYTQRTIAPPVLAVPLMILAFAAGALVHPVLVACAAAWLAVCAVPLTVIDAAESRLPDPLTMAALGGTATFLLCAAGFDGTWPQLSRSAAGAAALAGLFLVLAIARPGSAGLGDAKLSLSLGALATWPGWNVLLGAVLAAFLLGACYGSYLLATRHATLRTRLPFGPFLLAGTLLAVLVAGAR